MYHNQDCFTGTCGLEFATDVCQQQLVVEVRTSRFAVVLSGAISTDSGTDSTFCRFACPLVSHRAFVIKALPYRSTSYLLLRLEDYRYGAPLDYTIIFSQMTSFVLVALPTAGAKHQQEYGQRLARPCRERPRNVWKAIEAHALRSHAVNPYDCTS